MEYKRIDASRMNDLWELQKAYKAAIHEDAPDKRDYDRLKAAIEKEQILFFGAWDGDALAGCCSVTVGFSTFNYQRSGVFEDLYIVPERRHQGIARVLTAFAYKESGVSSMTVGCADCDIKMYQALGFSAKLGNLLAYA